MNVYTTDKIRNVVILGHGGAGKTSPRGIHGVPVRNYQQTGEMSQRGNTISDFDKEEIKRKFSISTSMVPVIWGDTKVNILDTPGYFDFVGEAEEAAAAAERGSDCSQRKERRGSGNPEGLGSSAINISCPESFYVFQYGF